MPKPFAVISLICENEASAYLKFEVSEKVFGSEFSIWELGLLVIKIRSDL